MRTTIKSVAEACGVSQTTVSLILNGKPSRISEETRQLILDTAQKLDYRPNRLAISLATKKTNTIGLLVPDISNLFFAALAKSIETRSHSYGFNILLGNTEDNPKLDLYYLQMFLDRSVEGILYVHSASANEKDIEQYRKLINTSGIPIIMIDRYIEGVNSNSISINNRHGGYMVTKHLLEQGHRRIGCITGPHYVSSTIQRLLGYQQALSEHNIPYDHGLICEGDYDIETGRKFAPALLARGVTSIFAFSDMIALGVYKELRELNINIPGEISVVGFDDIFVADMLDVPLTTVYQPVKEMGAVGVDQLIQIIRKESTGVRDLVFEPTLKVRSSTKKLAA